MEAGTLAERYVIEALLGSGAMATVYRVRHVDLGTPHAMKVLALGGEALQQRMLQEGRIQAGLRHPNIVAVTDVVRIAGAPALVMEYIHGPTLEALLTRYHPSLLQADHIGQDIIRGVGAAHAQGLVHRDLKPANILLATQGDRVVAKVADFGIAKVISEGRMTSTQTGTTMGTPTFMAPEQFRSAKEVDARADVFSLGAILYEVVCGAPCFSGEDLIECFTDASEQRYVRVRERLQSVPARMERAIEGALVADRERRIPDCATLLKVWRGEDEGASLPSQPPGSAWEGEHLQVLAGLAPSVRDQVPAPTRAWSPGPLDTVSAPVPTARVRWPLVVVAGAVLLGGVGFVVGWQSRRPPPAEIEPDLVFAPSAPIQEPEPEPEFVASVEPTPGPTPPTASPRPKTVAPDDVPATPKLPEAEGNVVITGASRAYLVDARGARHSPGRVAPGSYTLYAFFDEERPERVADVRIEPGRRYVYRCEAMMRNCRLQEGG